MNASAATPGAAWRKHGIEPMPHSDGKELTLLGTAKVMIKWLPKLTDALLKQAAAIDRLAASNEAMAEANQALVESLMAEVEQGDDEDQPQRYMDGTPVEH